MSNDSVTIKEIAKLLGISKSTVSRALSDHSDVNTETRKKILEVAQKMNYQPNTIALNLKQRRTNTIGVIIPETMNRFFSKATAGIQRIANLAGYNIIICQSDESLVAEKNNLRSLIGARVDGVLISVSEETNIVDHFDLLLQKKIPVVFFDRIAQDLDTSRVVTDNFEIALEGTEHLIEQGCKRIAWISGPQHLYNSKNRLQGYVHALTKHGIPVQEEYIIKSHFKGGNVEEYTNYLLNLPHPPDGIFAINDYAAIEMIHYIKKRGLQIPKDIAILGFNNERVGRFIEPSLSTIDLSAYDLGSAAAEILIHQIKHAEHLVREKLIKSSLIVRESSRRI
jgi:DNA-binding LacI/PurR family transcriptional regulator